MPDDRADDITWKLWSTPAIGGCLTLEMLQKSYNDMMNLRIESDVLIMSPVQWRETWIMFNFPTLYYASLYKTPWERLLERCQKKMREMETYSSHKAAERYF